MKKSLILLLTLLLIVGSCVYPVQDNFNHSSDSYLTVDARFSDQPETQTVSLSYSSPGLQTARGVQFINDAKVFILDDLGGRIDFKADSTGKGVYKCSIPGKAGRTYTLHILTADKKSYSSTPQLMNVCPEIDKISYEAVKDTRQYPPSAYYLNVTLGFTDPPSPDNYYQWSWTHYQTVDICEICEGGLYDYATNSCKSQESEKNKTNQFYCDNACWDISKSSAYNLLADTYFNGKAIDGIPISRVPFSTPPFQYYLQVQQKSISKSVFVYYQSLASQLQSNGTLFDVPAQTLFNINLHADNDPAEKVIGIFNVYSQKKKIVYLDLTQPVNGIYAGHYPAPPGEPYLVLKFGHLEPVTIPCVNSLTRTNTLPEGWK